MPKKESKNKQAVSPVGDDDAKSEAGTAISSGSEAKTITLDDGNDGIEDQVDVTASLDHLQDKLKDAVESATDNSAKTRETALAELCLGCERHLLPDFVIERQATLADIIERSLRRGKSTEQVLAARLGALLCIQLGADCEEIYGKIRPVLLTAYADKSVSAPARSACAEVLGIGSFVSDDDPEVFADVIRKLSKTFSNSYLKGDNTSPQNPPDQLALHTQSLLAWGLLMSVAADHITVEELNLHLKRLPDLLETADVDLRIATGETIALMNEVTRDVKLESSRLPNFDVLCTRLRELSTESTKHRAKKDNKQQRASFRDVLHSVEDDDGVYQRVRFGKEVLDLHTWRTKFQYEALCSVLRTGMNYHLRRNPLVRQIFDLGDPLIDNILPVNNKKADKFQRQLQQTAVEKERTQARNLHRGNKRAGKVDYDDE